jgi:hypothetical protein
MWVLFLFLLEGFELAPPNHISSDLKEKIGDTLMYSVTQVPGKQIYIV